MNGEAGLKSPAAWEGGARRERRRRERKRRRRRDGCCRRVDRRERGREYDVDIVPNPLYLCVYIYI